MKMKKMISVKGKKIFSEDNQSFIPKGINMVCKDKSKNYIGDYNESDFRFLREKGFNLVRLGLIWDGAEPEPGHYDKNYFRRVDKIIEMAAGEKIPVFLDLHQDLYGSVFEDGAPEWATFTDDQEHVRTELWSESYLLSPAVQHAFDNFWNNTRAEDGTGIRTHYIQLLKYLAERYKDNPYVVGLDIMNEPFPGSAGAVAGEKFAAFMADGNLEALSDDKKIAALIKDIYKITSKFEEEILNPFYDEAAELIRSVDKEIIFMFEANYFANAGVPSVVRPACYEDGRVIENQIYVPHGYDILVDTEAYSQGGVERVDFIFRNILRHAEEINVPAIIGEWGCYPNASEGQKEQAKYLLNLFKQHEVGNVYFEYSHLKDNNLSSCLFL